MKFIKLAGKQYLVSLAELFNKCASSSHFPSDLQLAEIIPIFKKNDILSKENYRSLNILHVVFTLFEKIISQQFIVYFQDVLVAAISAYRKGHSCQHVLLQLTEFWRNAMDAGENVSSVAMDLSRAFYCMPHLYY